MGSGEFEPWSAEVERLALNGAAGDGTAVVLATASAPEGEAVFRRWGAAGVGHFGSLGVPARALPLRDRADAHRPELAAEVGRASLVFLSGGNPEYLGRVLAGTPVFEAIATMLREGAVYAGCSAGAMVAGARVAGASGRLSFGAGLGLVPGEVFGVHWDARFLLPWRSLLRSRVPAGSRLVGIPERTAVLDLGDGWQVFGRAPVEIRVNGRGSRVAPGQRVPAL